MRSAGRQLWVEMKRWEFVLVCALYACVGTVTRCKRARRPLRRSSRPLLKKATSLWMISYELSRGYDILTQRIHACVLPSLNARSHAQLCEWNATLVWTGISKFDEAHEIPWHSVVEVASLLPLRARVPPSYLPQWLQEDEEEEGAPIVDVLPLLYRKV